MEQATTHDPEQSPWPFVGRADELALARRSLQSRRGLLVIGDAGVGKSRLVQELVATSGAGDRWHRLAAAEGLDAVAFGAWAHLLASTGVGRLDDAASWGALAERLRDPNGELRLVVEDAHWLDVGSAALLHQLVTAHGATALVTSRRRDPFLQPLTALWKDGHLVRLDLERLPPDAIGALLEAALGAPVEPRTVASLHARAGGDLFVVRELVAEAQRVDHLRLVHGAWVEVATAEPSPRVVDLVADRIEALAADERAAAEVLAVAHPVPVELLARLVPASTIDRLVERGIAIVEADGVHRVATAVDPLLAEVLASRLDARRRDEVIAGLVAVLGAAEGLGDADVVRLAQWRLDLGHAIDPDDALAASDLASARHDLAAAERLAAAALDAGGGLPATVRLGEALARQQRDLEADAALGPVADRLDELDDPLRFRYAQARALSLATERGMLDEAIHVLEATIATMADDRARWALEAHLSFLLADCGRVVDAWPLAEARLANVDEDESSALIALVACGLCRTSAGRCLDTLEMCEQMMPVALRHLDDRPEALGWIAAAQMLATYVHGDLVAANELADGVELLVADDPDPTVRAAALMSRGLILSERGQLDAAIRLLQQASALHEVDNRRGYQSWCFAIASRAHALRGDVEAAEVALDAARRHLWPGGQSFAGDLHVAAIWVAMLRGDRATATRTLDEALAWTERQGLATSALRLRHEAVRAGLPVAPHLEAFATTTIGEQSRWAAAQAVHIAALGDDDGAGLAAAGNAFAELGIHLGAAEAYAQAAGAHRRAGSMALAAQAKQQCEAQRARCEAAATPALRFGELIVGLTERELDVTTRAAAGEANQQIADALGISVRTAETHLQRAFAKLGIHRRQDLVAVFQPPAPARPS